MFRIFLSMKDIPYLFLSLFARKFERVISTIFCVFRRIKRSIAIKYTSLLMFCMRCRFSELGYCVKQTIRTSLGFTLAFFAWI